MFYIRYIFQECYRCYCSKQFLYKGGASTLNSNKYKR
nr:MAG TPA: hypothetical protein [Caudoviricetes sp.]